MSLPACLRREHGWRRVPSARVLRQWTGGFQTLGTVAPVGIHAPRPRVPVTLVQAIGQALARNPRLSVRRTVYNVVRRQLGVFAYKLQLVQRLKRKAKATRLRFCRWALAKWPSPRFRRCLTMSDEAQF